MTKIDNPRMTNDDRNDQDARNARNGRNDLNDDAPIFLFLESKLHDWLLS